MGYPWFGERLGDGVSTSKTYYDMRLNKKRKCRIVRRADYQGTRPSVTISQAEVEKYVTGYVTLFKLIQDWQKILDKPEGKVGAILMDLSKAFDCLPHDLLIAKLAAYGFDNNSLLLLQSHLSNRKQRTKIGSYFSSWLEIILGVPQGSILGPLLFNIFINDVFYIIEESKLCNFADDNTIYSCHTSVDAIITNLEIDLSNVLEWFKKNQVAENPDKFQMIVLGLHNRKLCINMGNHNVNSTNEVKLLGLIIDHKLNFNSHINTLCTTASKKLKCLRRIRNYISIPQAKILCNSYIYSTFNYCSLIWIFCSKIANNKINKIHLRTLKTIYLNDESSLYKLLETDNSESIHSRHIKVLLAEIFKSLSNLNPTFMWNIFNKKYIPYSLRTSNLLTLPTTNTKKYGTNSIVFKGSMLWNSLPDSYKNEINIVKFKAKHKDWRCERCTCQLCTV